MKIGILGGSFHPIHNGHLDMARSARDTLGLDQVILMVDRIPPHKELAQGANSQQRYAMVQLACEGERGFVASDWELNREGTSYTALTLTHLSGEHPEDELYFIMGSDMLRSLTTWYHPEIVCEKAHLVCICRAGQDGGEEEAAATVMAQYGASVTLLPPVRELSSTEVRNRLMGGQPITGLVPPSVEWYIYEQALYVNEQLAAFTAAMKEVLNPRRFRHVIGVEVTAIQLAENLGADGPKARLAALLHDCAKYLPVAEQFVLAKQDGSTLPREAEAILHAPAGACLAREKFGVTDKAVLQAIRYHTTGEEDMTLLDEIIWAADLIEPGRDYPSVEKHRALLLSAHDQMIFEKGLLLVFIDNIWYIQNEGRELYPATLRARDALARKTTAKETYMETLNKETILQLCKILYNKKAMDIRAIEVTDKTIIADWFIVCSGRGVPQVKALSDELEEKAAEMGLFPRRKEGYQEGRWIVLDFGDLLVHLFHPEERTYYNLERLWDDGQNVITYTEEGDAK
jgi:nicotinate-nucleotide adenylyltransferase